MPRNGALRDAVNTESAMRAVSENAAARLSDLRADGHRYPWTDLLPGVVARALELLLANAEPTDADRRRVVAAARRCARDWVPLAELEQYCHILLSCLFAHLWNEAGADACAELLLSSSRAADSLTVLRGWARHAYVEELCKDGTERAHAQWIAGLVNGQDSATLAAETGLGLPVPAVVACVAPAGTGQPGHTFDRVPPELRKELEDGALSAPSPDGTHLVVFLPMPAAGEAAIADRGARLAAACSGEHGHGFVTGMAHVPGAGDAPAALREAMWAADLMARGGRVGRAMFLPDLSPEAVIDGRPDLRERLLSRAWALRGKQQLWSTLRTLYDCDLDRGRTARWLGIHRSTLDYRLDRVRQLTGISPTSVRGIVLLSTALAADALSPD